MLDYMIISEKIIIQTILNLSNYEPCIIENAWIHITFRA